MANIMSPMSFSFPLMNSEVPFATPAIILTKLTRSVVSVTFGVSASPWRASALPS